MAQFAARTRFNVIFFTNGGLYGSMVMQRLLASEQIRLVAIVVSTRKFKPRQSSFGALRFALRQFGTRYLNLLLLATDVADCIGAVRGTSVSALAKRHGIKVFRTDQINQADVVGSLEQLDAAVLLSAFFNQKISENTAAVASRGAFNIHPALLPKFRGVDPVFQMQRRGDHSFGATLHRIAAEFDEGNIVRQRPDSGSATDSALALTARSFANGASLFLEAIEDGSLWASGEPQTDKGCEDCYDSWPDKRQVADYFSKGNRLWTAQDLVAMCWGRSFR
jgi:folate-dependent phosphoribosylglycinamide formyltransferase PurN